MTDLTTIANAIPRNRYACDGANKTFNIQDTDSSPVVFLSNSEIVVYHYDATDDSISTLVEGVDYSITGGHLAGVITTLAASAYPLGDYIAFRRELSASQDTNLITTSNYESQTMMNVVGKGRMIDQDLLSEVRRAIKRHPVFGNNESVELPYAPGKIMVGSSDGGIEVSTATAADVVATATAVADAQAAQAAAEAAKTAAETAETNAETAETNAETAGTNAEAAQTAAESARDAAVAASETLAWRFEFDTATTDADPGSTKFRFNNTSFAAATQVFISETAIDGDLSAVMDIWDDSSSAIKATIKVRNPASPTRWAEFYVTGTITDAGSYRKIPISPIAINTNDTIATTFPDETEVLFGVFRNGDAGTGAVASWNSRTGSVTPAASDYDASQIDNDSGVSGSFVSDALDTLDSGKAATSHSHSAGDVTSGTFPIARGGTGGATDSAARTALGLAIGSDVQAYHANLAALAGLVGAANKILRFTGAGALGLLDFLDEDDFTADSDTGIPSQQSVKAYVDANAGGGWTLGTEQATTSGTTKDFTSIPSGVSVINIMFNGVSLGSAGDMDVTLGDAGGLETTDYISSSYRETGSGEITTSTTKFALRTNDLGAGLDLYGTMTLTHMSGNTWMQTHTLRVGSSSMLWGTGRKTLSAELDLLRITAGATFDAGAVNIMYQ